MSVCNICDREFKNYQGRKRTRCGGCYTKFRRYIAKKKAIEYLGGKCERCGYDGHQAAFEFHHKDPTQKDFAIGSAANKSWKVIKEEIKKCELLCSNCHRIEHSNMEGEKFLEAVKRYNSRTPL